MFDFLSSWFLINYLNAGIGESNPLAGHNNHQIFDIPIPFIYLQVLLLTIFIGMCIAAYWYGCLAWRHLTPEARQRYRCLQWPYQIGFMKDVI